MKKAAPFLFLVLIFVAAGWYFFTREPDPAQELQQEYAPPPIPAAEAGPEPEMVNVLPEPEAESEPEVIIETLPELNESDAAIKPALGEIVGPDLLDQYLVKDQIISRLVATVDSLTSRQVPPAVNPAKSVRDKFVVEVSGETVVLSSQNFSRYDAYVGMFDSVDTGTLMTTYERYFPLFQQAWEDNGHEGSFNQRALEVIDHLLETPDVPGPVYLTKPEAFYLFEDPELEALSAGQKILVRMGNVNAAIVKEKLLEIRSMLGTTGP